MDLVKEITKNIKIVLKNKIEEQAIENMLYAKIAHLFALKGIKFISTNNLKKPATLAYYAVNFICSGGSKNQAISTLEDCVLPFLDEEYKKLDFEMAKKMLAEEIDLLDETSKNYANEKRKLEKKYADGGVINFKTNGGTPASLYAKLEKIEKYKIGALLAQITEFSDYFRTSVENNLSTNRSFLDCLNNLYEGLFEPSDSMGTTRKEIKGVPFSLLFMSDIEELLEPKNNENFKRRLKSGYARRMNFYINKDVNYSKIPPAKVTIQQKQEAYENLHFCSALIKKIYDELPKDTEFVFTAEANEALDTWEEKCATEVGEFYKFDNRLSLENNIKKIEIENSTWKITKMAVLIQILKGEKIPKVTADSVSRAIEFYKKCRKSLYDILDEHQITKESELVSYFLNHIGEVVKKNDIRALQLVKKDYFSRWYNEAINDVQDMLNEKGFELVRVKGKGNTQAFVCQKMIKPEETLINVSYSNDNALYPADGYEYIECTTDAFVDLILNSKALSAQRFKDGHRCYANSIGVQNTLWLDFDEGITLEEAKKKFKDYWYVIYPSMHHQKEKDGKPACDRFRVVLKVKEPMPKDKDRYQNIMERIALDLGADEACKDFSRYYRGNPDAEFVWENRDGDFFDWTFYDKPEKGQEKPVIKIENPGNGFVCGLTDENLFTTEGERLLKADDIYTNHRDEGFAVTVGILIQTVKNGNITHSNALKWLDNKLNEVMTSDFKQNAQKYRRRLEKLEF